MPNFFTRTWSRWFTFHERPEHYRELPTDELRHVGRHEADTLSPFYAAKDLYKRSLSLCPLVVYKRDEVEGRVRARNHWAYKILHDRPNPSMSRIDFLELMVEEYFTVGEFVAVLRWNNNNTLKAMYPVPHSSIVDVRLDDEWNKTWVIKDDDNNELEYPDEDIFCIIKDSKDGIRGRSIFEFASESLGLHRQIMETANAYFKNAAKPSMYIHSASTAGLEARKKEHEDFNANYTGTRNTGKIPFFYNAEPRPFPGQTAEESALIEAMNSCVADVARWMAVSPLLLADLTRGTYSNLSADNSAFYQKSLQPFMEKVQNETNYKVFQSDPNYYAEFLTEAVLRGDPKEQKEIIIGYIQSGVMLRSEARDILNMPAIPGLDVPLAPLNQGPTPTPEPAPETLTTEVPLADPNDQDQI